jgi:membrane protease YdiL (CAAX protease family)
VLLALLSLALSALLWVNGLLGSLERPSVGNALNVRQLQLEVLAAPALPDALRPWLTGGDPGAALADALQSLLDAEAGPGDPDTLLQLALLEKSRGATAAAEGLLQRLAEQVPPEQRPLLRQLATADARADGAAPSNAALTSAALTDAAFPNQTAPWQATLSPLSRQLLCAELGSSGCRDPAAERQAALRLFGVSWLPALLLLLGVVLLLREIWLLWRGRLPLGPLLGPQLNLVEVTLLIAGGFVVLGELSVPLLLAPLSQWLLAPLAAEPVRQQSLQVVLLYGGLMLPPLLILRAQLRAIPGPAPEGGWLQWYWRPLPTALRRALGQWLMVLPLVALSGWLVHQLLGDPGGSNPLLELVLTARDPLALAGFALTATVLAPLFEETLFRGVLLPVLGRQWGPRSALLASALVFALAHLSLGELVPLLVLGLGLGWLRLRSGRLAPCVVMHALWNGLTFANLVLLAG